MKKLTFLTAILLALPIIGFGQNVNIPDANFKFYLVTNPSINTNGDNQIQVSEASVFNEGIGVSLLNITDLTGIEAFVSLTTLNCSSNQITSLDLSANTALTSLSCDNNNLTSLDVSTNTALTSLSCASNNLTSLDVSSALTYLSCSYTQLSSLNLSTCTVLTQLYLTFNNNLTSLDVSANTALTFLSCTNNQLTYLNVKNGNNTNMNLFANFNPNLSCIEVDNVAWSNTNWQNIDAASSFSLNCSGAGISDINESNTLMLYPNPTNGDFTITGLELVGSVSSLTLTDMNGKVVKVLDTKATKFSMGSIKPGVYFLNIISGNKQEVLKIVKE